MYLRLLTAVGISIAHLLAAIALFAGFRAVSPSLEDTSPFAHDVEAVFLGLTWLAGLTAGFLQRRGPESALECLRWRSTAAEASCGLWLVSFLWTSASYAASTLHIPASVPFLAAISCLLWARRTMSINEQWRLLVAAQPDLRPDYGSSKPTAVHFL